MVRFELKRLLREGIVLLLLSIVLMAYIMTTDKDPYMPSILLEVFLLVYVSFTGWSMFESERHENAVEYLLSMPISRTRLFLVKFLPRLAMIIFFLGLYLLLHHFYEFPSYLPPVQFPVVYFSFFLISLSFSLTIYSFIGVLFFTTFFSVGLSYYFKTLSRLTSDFSAILKANLILLIFPVVFFILFHTFDIRPMRWFNYKFLMPVLVLIGIVMSIFWFQTPYGWGHYYITTKHDVFRSSCGEGKAEWLHGINHNEVTPMRPSTLVLREYNDWILVQVLDDDSYESRKIDRIHLVSGERETLMEIPENWSLTHGLDGVNGFVERNLYYNILYNKKENQYKIITLSLDSTNAPASEIPLYGNVDERIYYIFHITESPQRFYLMGSKNLYWTNSSGEIQFYRSQPREMAVWKNRLATFDENNLTIYELGNSLQEVFHKEGNIRKIRWRTPFYQSEKVLINLDKKIHLLDMESLTIQPLSMNNKPYSYIYRDSTLHLLWIENDEAVFGKLQDEKAVITGRHKMTIEGKPLIMRPYPNGIVIFNQKDFQAFYYAGN